MRQGTQQNHVPIRVLIRVRPKTQNQKLTQEILEVSQNKKVLITHTSLSKTIIQFDNAFSSNSTQKEFFEPFQQPIKKLLLGYNMTVLAYGQTGSGKTHTMFGKDWDNCETLNQQGKQKLFDSFSNIKSDENCVGLIPRAIKSLFKQLQTDNQNKNQLQFNIFCSFFQIYNEKVFDLLQNSQKLKPLEIHESNHDGIFIEGLSEFKVTNNQDCLKLINYGRKNAHVRQTHMNTKSSRSHLIFQVFLESLHPDENGLLKKAKLTFCDLAGSQKVNKDQKMSQQHLLELKNINKSLTTLGKVISSLSSKSKEIYAPFRQSKLTRLLKQSLTGNTQTFIIGTLSPSELNLQETMNTLRFLERARHIVTKVEPIKVEEQSEKMVHELQKQIFNLKKLLKLKNKGFKPQQIQKKVQQLEQENEKLKNNYVSAKDYSKLVAQNNKMRQQIYKLKLNNHLKTENETIIEDRKKSHLKSQESPSPQKNKIGKSQKVEFKEKGSSKTIEVTKITKEIKQKFRSKSKMKGNEGLSKSHLPQIEKSKRINVQDVSPKIVNKSAVYSSATIKKDRYSSLDHENDFVEVKKATDIFNEPNKSKLRKFLQENKQSPPFLSIQMGNLQKFQLNGQQPKIQPIRSRRRMILPKNRDQKILSDQLAESLDQTIEPKQVSKISKNKEKQLILKKLSEFQTIKKMNQSKLFKDLEKCRGKTSTIQQDYSLVEPSEESNQSRVKTQRKVDKSKERKSRIFIRRNQGISFQQRIRQLQARIRSK